MKGMCEMCGDRPREQELCRAESHNERWCVCGECAWTMLNDPDLRRMWQRADPRRTRANRGNGVHLIREGPTQCRSLRTPFNRSLHVLCEFR